MKRETQQSVLTSAQTFCVSMILLILKLRIWVYQMVYIIKKICK